MNARMIDWNTINNGISQAVLDNDLLGTILSDLGCDPRTPTHRASFRLPCPIHGGDSRNMEIKAGGSVLPIRWHCFSHGCQDQYKPSLLGLVRGILSVQQGRKARMREVVGFLSRYIQDLSILRSGSGHQPEPEPQLLNISRERVRRRLMIPSRYFLGRGFSPAVLNAFDVGDSSKMKRAVVPLYDDTGLTCIGYMARSIWPECKQCKMHHFGPGCRYRQGKWKLPDGFPKGKFLYNYATAKATDAPFIFLVEGAPDVWRLAEAGYVGVALFGSKASDEQLRKLEALGKEVWLAFDNDDRGEEARTLLGKQKRSSRIYYPGTDFRIPLAYKDPGDTPVQTLRRAIQEWVEVLAKNETFYSDPEEWPCQEMYDEALERAATRLREHDAWLRKSPPLA